jgi:hypothetical protein
MLDLDYKSIAQIFRHYKAYQKDMSQDSKNSRRYSTQFEIVTKIGFGFVRHFQYLVIMPKYDIRLIHLLSLSNNISILKVVDSTSKNCPNLQPTIYDLPLN